MARTSEKVGRGLSPCCGEMVTFHRTKGGLLNYECYGCDSTHYAHKNGDSERDWMARINQAKTDPEPAPAPAPTPAPAPAPRKSSVLIGN